MKKKSTKEKLFPMSKIKIYLDNIFQYLHSLIICKTQHNGYCSPPLSMKRISFDNSCSY